MNWEATSTFPNKNIIIMDISLILLTRHQKTFPQNGIRNGNSRERRLISHRNAYMLFLLLLIKAYLNIFHLKIEKEQNKEWLCSNSKAKIQKINDNVKIQNLYLTNCIRLGPQYIIASKTLSNQCHYRRKQSLVKNHEQNNQKQFKHKNHNISV